MRVQHKDCGSTEIRVCTLVPRIMDVVSWDLNPDGTVSPNDYGEDDAMWEAEVSDPDGDYWCNECMCQFNDDELEIIHEPNDGWEARIKNALLQDLKL